MLKIVFGLVRVLPRTAQLSRSYFCGDNRFHLVLM